MANPSSAASSRAPLPSAASIRVPLSEEERHNGYSPDLPTKLSDITWRVFRIMAEFVEGFEFLSHAGKSVSIFGSTRFQPDHPWYEEARRLAHKLGKGGFTVITGGGPGIMEAANRGAYEAGAPSLGLNIELPHEQRINPYVRHSRGFHYFFTRKVMLAAASMAYVYFPGGLGTLDEMAELTNLIQTEKMQRIPIILVGKDFWSPLLAWIEKTMGRQYKTISPEDTSIYRLVDSADEAFELIRSAPDRAFF